MPECTQAVIYARKSKSRSTRGKGNGHFESSEAQVELCHKRCEDEGWEVLASFVENESGKSVANRPAFRMALDMACQHRAALVVYSLCRFGRSLHDLLDCTEQLHKAKAQLVCLKDKIDTTSAFGELHFHLMGALAQYQRRVISESTSEMKRAYQAQGFRMSARLPFGYKLDPCNPKRMIPKAEEQTVIRLVVGWRHDGCSLREICRRLTAAKYEPRGTFWRHQLVTKILEREGVG